RNPAFSSALKVVTTKMRPGYLRRNGVPYSDKAVMTEFYDRTNEANGESWLVVTSIVDDPTYLNQPFVTSAHFRKENDQSRWNPTINTLPEHQCIPLPADDFTDFGNIRIWKEIDPVTQRVIAWHEYTEWQAQERVIWMDGRPHPSPYAPHTWQGFSTGKWERNQLTITTTHLKTAPYERVGTYRSDLGTLAEHWMRHGNYLTIMVIISDPVYLAEPL